MPFHAKDENRDAGTSLRILPKLFSVFRDAAHLFHTYRMRGKTFAAGLEMGMHVGC